VDSELNVFVSDFGFARAKGISNTREGGTNGGALLPLLEEEEQEQVWKEGGRGGGREGRREIAGGTLCRSKWEIDDLARPTSLVPPFSLLSSLPLPFDVCRNSIT